MKNFCQKNHNDNTFYVQYLHQTLCNKRILSNTFNNKENIKTGFVKLQDEYQNLTM